MTPEAALVALPVRPAGGPAAGSGAPQVKRRLLWCWLVLLLASGCVTPVSEADLERQLAQAAGSLTRAGSRQVIPIHAETKFVAWSLLAEARSDHASPLSVQLGHRIELAARRGMDIVVGGPYPELTDQLVVNALSQDRDRLFHREYR